MTSKHGSTCVLDLSIKAFSNKQFNFRVIRTQLNETGPAFHSSTLSVLHDAFLSALKHKSTERISVEFHIRLAECVDIPSLTRGQQ